MFDFGLGGSLSRGSLISHNIPDSRLDISMTTLMLRAWINTLWDEPYFVPFLSLEFPQVSITESFGNTQFTKLIQGVTLYRVGLQIQLNALDEDGAKDAYISSGLENTFLEISYFDSLFAPNAFTLTPFSGVSVGIALEF